MDAIGSPEELANIDPDEIAQLLDDESAADLRRLQDLASCSRRPATPSAMRKRLELTPRGARRLGQGVLDELFGKLRRDVFGGHQQRASGAAGERDAGSRPYEFGRPFDLNLPRDAGQRVDPAAARAGHQARAGRFRNPRDEDRREPPRCCSST